MGSCSEGRFNGGFFALRLWGAYIWRGLYTEGFIFGILRYRIGQVSFWKLYFAPLFLPSGHWNMKNWTLKLWANFGKFHVTTFSILFMVIIKKFTGSLKKPFWYIWNWLGYFTVFTLCLLNLISIWKFCTLIKPYMSKSRQQLTGKIVRFSLCNWRSNNAWNSQDDEKGCSCHNLEKK